MTDSASAGIGAPTPGPLSGLVVADFSRVLAGPYATMLLADLGADVIKVESPAGDDTRHWMPPIRDGVGTYYLAINRNKRSIVLDLADPDDIEVAHALSARADVFIQNFKPGGLVRFGLDYDAVRARNPAVIYCSISGFGTAGGAALPGYDLLVQAVSGLMSLTGSPDGPPYRSGISLFDVMTGLHSRDRHPGRPAPPRRDRRGPARRDRLLSSALSALVNQTSAYVAGGVMPRRMGNAHLSLFPYEPLPTGDGELIVAAGNDGQFRRLCQAIGAPELADDPTVRHRPATATSAARSSAAAARAAGHPFRGRLVRRPDRGRRPVRADQRRQPGRRAGRPTWAWRRSPTAGGIPTTRNPITLSATPARYDLAPPALDADGAAVRAWLGFGSQEGG